MSDSTENQPSTRATVVTRPKPASRNRRAWLLFLLLLTLIVLLFARADLRSDARQSLASATRTLVVDGLGISPRQWFVLRLRVAGLYGSPLGERWRTAVDRAGPVIIGRRVESRAAFAADAVKARVFAARLDRGEQIEWRLARDTSGGARLYASLERRDRPDDDWSTVTALVADDETDRVVAARGGDYRIVLQPELFGAVDYRLSVATGGSLDFPVVGAARRDIGSGFGAPRDGGKRAHHGVDIFAERGTPVTAVVGGRVRRSTGGIGGKHVWLSGGLLGIGGTRYYYAHLDSFAVASGERVRKGEVLGHVGNTGNARTTPPHLHFGIYTAGGPVDPAPFLRPMPRLPGN